MGQPPAQPRGCPVCFKSGPECRCGLPTRREFLKIFGVGAAVVVAPEPVRRYWFFGLDTKSEDCQRKWEHRYTPAANTLFQDQNAPGTIKLHDGTVVRLGDFKESDMYSTIVVSPTGRLLTPPDQLHLLAHLNRAGRVGQPLNFRRHRGRR